MSIAKKFVIIDSTIHIWLKSARSNVNKIESRKSGNFSSDETKEIARLKKEIKNTQDALEVLKKTIGVPGKQSKHISMKLSKNQRKRILKFQFPVCDILPYEDIAFFHSYEWLYNTSDRNKESVEEKCNK